MSARTLALLTAVVLSCSVSLRAQQAADDASCRTCHPGAVRGLRQSRHAVLLARPDGGSCAQCHGDVGAHAAAAARPAQQPAVVVAPVVAAACASCHPGQPSEVAAGAHALVRVPEVRGLPPAAAMDRRQLADLAQADVVPTLRWSGLLDIGYRLVHVAGSREGYATDVDLEPGVRARTLELRGTGSGGAAFDDLWLRAADVGDPRWGIDGGVRQAGVGAFEGTFQRARYRYAAAGDFHRVDRSARSGTAELELELGDGLRAFGSLTHHDEDGYWLTERVGNRNVSVQSYVTGVASPRTQYGDLSELGLVRSGDTWTWTVATNWREDRARDRWLYSRPAPANPSFPESEDFASRSSLRGPGARMLLQGEFDELQLDVGVRWFDHDRRVTAAGTGAGFDVAQFTSVTTAGGDGAAETWLGDLGATLDLAADWQLFCDLRWRDHSEDMLLRQRDVTTFPTLSTTVTVDTLADQHTAQRLLDGETTLAWAAASTLDLGLGYGFAHEQLRVPEVDPSDPGNFRRGTTKDHGVLANARWRPAYRWTVAADWRAFAQDGVLLHELAPSSARETAGSVGYAGDRARATAFVRHRHNENDVSQHRLDSLATGVTAGFDRRGVGGDVAYTWSRVDNRTLTNFYFDPDPNPVPTLVGFAGDTNVVSGSLRLLPAADVQWEFTAAWAKTTGDFAVSSLDWRGDLRWQVAGRDGAVGMEYRYGYYRAEGGLDDWGAQSLFVYWRQVW